MPAKNAKKIIPQAPKGMRDILPEEYPSYEKFYEKAEGIAACYGFSPIQTPHLERTELFGIGLGDSSDVIEKQMYTLKTRGGDNLALRPEGTAGVMRAYLEHGMHTLPQPVSLWYKGSFFRHENPQKGRLREFRQFGLEIINESKPVSEALVIKALTLVLEETGAGPVVVRVNSLGDKDCKNAYRKDLLAYYRKNLDGVCRDCKRRYKINPMRLLDCKEEKCAAVKKGAPQMMDYLCGPCKQHFKEVLEFLDAAEIAYSLDTHLVRGLDYYSRTVFEIFPDEGKPERIGETEEEDAEEKPAEIALASGGRYDYLAKAISGKDFPAVGGAIGVDRAIAAAAEKNGAKSKKNGSKAVKVFLVQLGTAAKQKSVGIIEKFRKARVPLAHSLSKDSLKGQLKIASKLGVPFSLIVGQKEALENSVIIHNMESRAQETVPANKVVEIIRKKLAAGR